VAALTRGRQNAAGTRLRCPLCRFEAPVDYDPVTAPSPLVHLMRQVFPARYAQREAQQLEAAALEEAMAPLTLQLRIGNRHELVSNPQRAKNGKHLNKHRWTMFVESATPGQSGALGEWTQHIATVKFELTPFFPQDAVLRSPPFTTTRVGWGYFDVKVTIVFKDARAPQLEVEHELCFDDGDTSEIHQVQLSRNSDDGLNPAYAPVANRRSSLAVASRRSSLARRTSSVGAQRPATSQNGQRPASSRGASSAQGRRPQWR